MKKPLPFEETLKVPFNRPFATGNEMSYIQKAISYGQLSGDGPFTRLCQHWLTEKLHCKAALLTTSGTAALEMAAVLLDINAGDEIIMPSFTFVSTANAFVRQGAVPVFIDIREDTLNIDETLVQQAVTKKTKAVVPVHYAGGSCEMNVLLQTAAKAEIAVVEDAAHAIFSTYRETPLGSIGRLGALSFHETKNLHCGEGGALLINDDKLVERAEILWQKGTDRLKYGRGEVKKYKWVDVGSSFLMSEINAAFLWSQFEMAETIQHRRLRLWQRYHEGFALLETLGVARRPVVSDGCSHNAHLYYLLLPNEALRDKAIGLLRGRGVEAIFHYVPLHSSPAGLRFARNCGSLRNTLEVSSRIVRLPLWIGMEGVIDSVIEEVITAVRAV